MLTEPWANSMLTVLRISLPFFLLHGLSYVPLVSSLSPFPLSKLYSNYVLKRLLNYTPQATLVRLLTINSINAYITSWVLYLSGGSEDPRLLLPAWISIASVRSRLLLSMLASPIPSFSSPLLNPPHSPSPIQINSKHPQN